MTIYSGKIKSLEQTLKWFLFLWLCAFLVLSGTFSKASVVEMSPESLIDSSDLIINGEYIGQQKIIVDGRILYLGVIDVDATVKGQSGSLVFILRSNPNLIISDQLKLQPGMTGLWLLQKAQDPQLKHIYQAYSPQRFMTGDKAALIMDKLQK